MARLYLFHYITLHYIALQRRLVRVGSNINYRGFQPSENETLYGGGINGLNPVDLIHRPNLESRGNSGEFSEQDQASGSNDSSADFRRLQQERILNQQQF